MMIKASPTLLLMLLSLCACPSPGQGHTNAGNEGSTDGTSELQEEGEPCTTGILCESGLTCVNGICLEIQDDALSDAGLYTYGQR